MGSSSCRYHGQWCDRYVPKISLAAAALGVTSIEGHITLDRTMYGSDQVASLEPPGLVKLVKDVRIIEKAIGDGVKKVTEAEKNVKAKLRPVNWRWGKLKKMLVRGYGLVKVFCD